MNVLVTGSLRKWLRQHAGVLSIRMVSEILLHLAELTPSRPMLVQKGAIGLILDLQSALVSQSTQAMTVVKEALINLAQLSARIMIRTNPAVIPSD